MSVAFEPVARVKIPTTSQTVPRLCLGTMAFGTQVDVGEARRMVDVCLDYGVDFMDTANIYSNGRSESILGEVLQGRRQRVIVASKVGIETEELIQDHPLSRMAVFRHAEASLRRLRTDYIDIYLLHQPDPKTSLDETLEALDELVVEGKVRYVGVSNYAASQICELSRLAASNRTTTPRFAQYMYNVLTRGVEEKLLPLCGELGILSMAYNPLAGGLLTAKHDELEPPAPGTRFDIIPSYLDRYWKPEQHHAVRQLVDISEGCSTIGIALRWLLHHTKISVVVIGAASFEQILQNLQAASEGPLQNDIVKAINGIWPNLKHVQPPYFY